jgi:phospholipase/carboxylesterase
MTTMTDTAGEFVHRFVPGSGPGGRALLLLHGTGGDETDLLPLGQMIAPGAALLSPRGKVLENRMPRFFRRLAEGVFDHEDVVRRAHELADFVTATVARHGLAAPVAIGFSNGANIAAAMMLLRPEVLGGAVLIRAMVPLPQPPAAGLAGQPVLILSGGMDPIVPEEEAAQLAAQLAAAGAAVDHEILPAGHGLTQADVTLARRWLAGLDRAGADAGRPR